MILPNTGDMCLDTTYLLKGTQYQMLNRRPTEHKPPIQDIRYVSKCELMAVIFISFLGFLQASGSYPDAGHSGAHHYGTSAGATVSLYIGSYTAEPRFLTGNRAFIARDQVMQLSILHPMTRTLLPPREDMKFFHFLHPIIEVCGNG